MLHIHLRGPFFGSGSISTGSEPVNFQKGIMMEPIIFQKGKVVTPLNLEYVVNYYLERANFWNFYLRTVGYFGRKTAIVGA